MREVIRRKDGFHIRLYDKTRSLHVLTEMLGVVKRFQTDSAVAAEEHAEYVKARDKFLEIVNAMRDRLGLDPEASPMEHIAEGVARGDETAKMLAERIGYGPTPRPPKPRPNPLVRT